MIGPAENYGSGDGPLFRSDNYPNEAVTPPSSPYPGQRKSHVDEATGTVHPAGSNDSVTIHVNGRHPGKGESAFTSFFGPSSSGGPPAALEGWGRFRIQAEASGFGTVLTQQQILEYLRFEAFVFPDFRAPATMEGPTGQVPWTPDREPMLAAATPQQARAHVDMITGLGVDPLAPSFNVSQRAQIYAAAANERLAMGSSAPGTATVTLMAPTTPAASTPTGTAPVTATGATVASSTAATATTPASTATGATTAASSISATATTPTTPASTAAATTPSATSN